jgi:hypothetical protein
MSREVESRGNGLLVAGSIVSMSTWKLSQLCYSGSMLPCNLFTFLSPRWLLINKPSPRRINLDIRGSRGTFHIPVEMLLSWHRYTAPEGLLISYLRYHIIITFILLNSPPFEVFSLLDRRPFHR